MTWRPHLALLILLLAACSAPTPGPQIAPAPAPEALPTVAPTPASGAVGLPRDLGTAPDDLRTVNWDAATIPGEFCDLETDATLRDGTAKSRTWGPVVLAQLDVTYGNLVGDDRAEAAMRLYCSNDGGTAAGTLQYAIVLFASDEGRMRTLGAVVPRRQAPGQLPTLLAVTEWRPSALVVTETWYRPSDSTCCPSGTAVVTWTWDGVTITPGPVHITG